MQLGFMIKKQERSNFIYISLAICTHIYDAALAREVCKAHAYVFTCVYICPNTNTRLLCVCVHEGVYTICKCTRGPRHARRRGTQITGVERDNTEGRCLHDIRA